MNNSVDLITILHKRIQYEGLLNKITLLTLDNLSVQVFMERAIEIIGNITDVSRVYLFKYFKDTNTLSNTFEWVSPGIAPEKDNLQNIPVESVLWWENILETNNIISYMNVEDIPSEEIKNILRPQNIKSILVVPLFVNQKYYGFVGFDECKYHREWLELDISLIKSISIIICQYVDKYYSYSKAVNERNQFFTIFNSIKDPIYITDIDTSKILFVNDAMQSYFNYQLKGKICYIELQNKNEPCEFCTNDIIKKLNGQPYEWEFYNPYINKHFKLIDRLLNINDVNMRFEHAVDITNYKKKEQNLLKENERLKKTNENLIIENQNKILNSLIETLNTALEQKDKYTVLHENHVSILAGLIAEEMNLPKEKIKNVKVAGLIHDIGKIGLSSAILNKTNNLSNIEHSLIKQHVINGYEIIKNIDFLCPIADIVLQHHERLDGSGYPNGLKEDEILIEAKILAVADTYSAMTSNRPYRPSIGINKAIAEIKNLKNVLDQDVVNALLKVILSPGHLKNIIV